jgi:hypothetical protein
LFGLSQSAEVAGLFVVLFQPNSPVVGAFDDVGALLVEGALLAVGAVDGAFEVEGALLVDGALLAGAVDRFGTVLQLPLPSIS